MKMGKEAIILEPLLEHIYYIWFMDFLRIIKMASLIMIP